MDIFSGGFLGYDLFKDAASNAEGVELEELSRVPYIKSGQQQTPDYLGDVAKSFQVAKAIMDKARRDASR